MMRQFSYGAAAILLAACVQSSAVDPPIGGKDGVQTSDRAQTGFMSSLLGEKHDLRFSFYGSLTDLNATVIRGSILVINAGMLERAERIATNDYPSLQDVLKRYGFTHIPTQPQLRVIQQNKILQTGFHDDEDVRKELLALRFSAGDVVIIARKE